MVGEWGDCVEGPSRRNADGYARNKDGRLAHRVAFFDRHGYMPVEPYVVDHLCRNRACVNPDHLQEVTRAENSRLGVTRREWPTECPRGHSDWGRKRTKTGWQRRCMQCHRESERRRAAHA